MSSRASKCPWVSAALLGAVACVPPQEDPSREIPPITWSGAQLDYAPQPGAYELCAGTLPYMDRYVALVADAMGMEIDQPLVYVHGSEDGETFCEHEGTLGCSFDDSVYSRVAPQEHEIVHGVRGWQGFSHLFFEEGTAEVFGDDAPLAFRVPSNGDLLEGVMAASRERGLPTHWYPRAGHFVAYLHERYGPEPTAALLQETNAFSSPDRAIEVLEDVTGLPWAEIQENYETQPECDQAHYRYPLYGCEEPTALRPRCDGVETVWISERVACDDPTTLGPRDGEIWKSIAVEIPVDGEYLFFSYVEEGAAGATITIEECSMGCGSIVLEESMGLVLPLERVLLRAGRYALRLTRPVEAPATVELSISGPDCE
ncbi:hypothetical protein [Paraliomyxa miuraensis]|uniref:hypothetical protein n=1 Tax=Paraliomyxa miuraensis TaxID=376150 RepID=UPI002256C473|nr:hypothetical protein [Paraliomyxa miuraensis]MCX4242077.1 hypothetical protein [Paraliomyxa miuraensis]